LSIHIFNKADQLHKALLQERAQGKTIGFVPTMGALHEGHRSLVLRALAENDIVVCSIFVNPTQFTNLSDFQKYPHMEEKDIQLLEHVNCHYVFIPSVDEMYLEDPKLLELNFGSLENTMEGEFRPGHFKGVATIVDRLFKITIPHNAYFGEKDFQQLAIIRSMSKQMEHSVNIIACPTLREDDGLAMSSRNLLLNNKQRKAAALIYQGIRKAQEFIPHHSVDAVRTLVIRYIEQSPLLRVQYFNIVDPLTLENVVTWNNGSEVQGCIAVLTEGPRLIDNIKYIIE
jgi:pantoate--beta-alanine ligase